MHQGPKNLTEETIVTILKERPIEALWGRKTPSALYHQACFGIAALREKVISLTDLFVLACCFVFPFLKNKKTAVIIERYSVFVYKKILGEELTERLLHGKPLTIFGKEFSTLPGELLPAIDLLEQILRADQYQAHTLITEHSYVIDAGANVGLFSVQAATIATRGHVYAFEPITTTFEILKKNTAAYQNISIFKNGLGEISKTKTIIQPPLGSVAGVFEDSKLYAEVARTGGPTETVPIITIDEFVATHNIPRVDFIKIDTEGYEANILHGAKETLKKYKPIIAMSAYHNPEDKQELPKIITNYNKDYICTLHTDCEEDFICAVKKDLP